MGTNRALKHVAEIQDSFQSMTKHSMTGIQALNNFLFESAGLRAWKAYNVGTGRFFFAGTASEVWYSTRSHRSQRASAI